MRKKLLQRLFGVALTAMICMGMSSCEVLQGMAQGMASYPMYGGYTAYPSAYSSTSSTSVSSNSSSSSNYKTCGSCGGTGNCKYCSGTGYDRTSKNNKCTVCKGNGRCVRCNGQGGYKLQLNIILNFKEILKQNEENFFICLCSSTRCLPVIMPQNHRDRYLIYL